MEINNVGMFGLGTVGTSVYDYFQRFEGSLNLTKIVVQDVKKPRYTANQELITQEKISNDPSSIFHDETIDVIIDATNCSTDSIIRESLLHNKSVVTANKKVIANYGNQLFELADEVGEILRIEATVGAEIPIVKTLSDYHFHGNIINISGILNGTCNYILTRQKSGLSFSEALNEAVDKGYAELPPDLDVSGQDTRYKLAILASVAMGVPLCDKNIVEQIPCTGIEQVSPSLLKFVSAYAKGNTVKLLASASKHSEGISLRVSPTVVSDQTPLGSTTYEDNCVKVTKEFGGTSYLKGKGAGGEPTAAAMISDLHWVNHLKKERIQPSHYGKFYRNSLPNLIHPSQHRIRPILESSSPENQVGVFVQKLQELSARGLNVEQIYNNTTFVGDNTPDYIILQPTTHGEMEQAMKSLQQVDCVVGRMNMYNIAHDIPFDLK